MNIKHYLNQAYRINEFIKSNQEQLLEMQKTLVSIKGLDYTKDKSNTVISNNASFEKAIDKIIDFEDKLYKHISDLVEIKTKIKRIIDSVENINERLVLQLRYLNFYEWNKICKEMHFSKRTIFRIHSTALASALKAYERIYLKK